MPESKQHIGLVERAEKEVWKALGNDNTLMCLVDKPWATTNYPPIIGGHRPDLYATTSKIVIVGEAKPPKDLESRRTKAQLHTFLRYIEGDEAKHLILAVDWSTTATATALLRNLAQDWHEVRKRVHVLDGIKSLTLAE